MGSQRWVCWAVVWSWVWGVSLMLSPALASVLPVGVNLIPNAALQGVPGQAPREMFHGISYDPSVARRGSPLEREGELRVDYAYSRDQAGKGVMDITLVNQAWKAANYTLNLSTRRFNLVAGQRVSMGALVSAQGVREPVMLTLGWQFYRLNGSYLSDVAPAKAMYRPHLGAEQRLTSEVVGGAPDGMTGEVPASVFPRLAVYNLPPGGQLKIRLSDVRMVAQADAATLSVLPLARPMADVAPGKVLAVTVPLDVKPTSGKHVPRLVLRSDKREQALTHGRPLNLSQWGRVQDVWRVRLPMDVPAGTYQVGYEVPSLKLKASLGAVVVRPGAGMWVGQAIHRYPGSSEKLLGPFQGDYDFVRSLASDEAHRMQWWLGPDEYDWRGLTRWAHHHAKDGQRRLVFTFSGSPRWASASPNQYAAMGVPGNAAPPAKQYRAAYERMVLATVERFKTRILASECWNEPNSTDFFTGTPTELADLCKSVHRATKAVDPKIPVICPQADDPSHLDWVYSAKTSAGEPIHQFCDMVGAHVYNRLGWDEQGRDFAKQRLADVLEEMWLMSRKYGIEHKPLAVTEFGINSCVLKPTSDYPVVFGKMPSEVAAEALYQSAAVFREMGVSMMAFYSYDHPNNNPECRPGGSFIRMTKVDWLGSMTIDSVVAKRVADAVFDFGPEARR